MPSPLMGEEQGEGDKLLTFSPPLNPLPQGERRKKDMDDIDKKILNILQSEFPLEERPFLMVAGRCGISEDEAIARIQNMKEEGIIRRIGAVFDGVKLGRVSTLCAARVPEDKIDLFVQTVNANKGVDLIGRVKSTNISQFANDRCRCGFCDARN